VRRTGPTQDFDTMMYTRLFVFIAIGLLSHNAAGAGLNWPAWRGPAGTGIAAHTGVPTTWSATKNVKWKIPLAGPGNSTPIVWNNRIFLTGATDDGAKRSLLCFARGDGKLLWQRDVTFEPKELTHDTNPYAAASPVTDGERVIVWHGSAGVFCYDFEGREVWQKDLGKFTHIWGYAASPVLVGNRVFLSCGPGVRCLLVALDKRNGEELWKRELAEAQAKEPKDFFGSWSTPVLHKSGGRQQLMLSLPKELRSFDPASGKDIWTCKGLGPLAYTSPLVAGDVAVAMSGYHGAALACRTDGSGDVTDTHRLWLHEDKNPQRVGSGVIVGEHIYILNEPGIAWCIELASGKKLWEERISSASWSSMVHVDGRLYVVAMDGETQVLKPNPDKCEVIAQNPLDGETTRASLAFADRQIFVRSYKHLYCIEEAESNTRAARLSSPKSDLTEAIAAVRQVGREGKGNREAVAAWRALSAARAQELPILLAALDGAQPLGANYLRAAIDAACERELSRGGKLPAADLEDFVLERSHTARGRRLAYEWLTKVDPQAPSRIVPKMLDDPSLEMRRDAVAEVLAAANKLAAETNAAAVETYERALAAARDLDQIKKAAEALKKLNRPVDLPAHLGFVMKWKLIGPFDNTNQAGFEAVYPPEKEFRPEAVYEGKNGVKVRWIDAATEDEFGQVDLNKMLAKHKGAVAYAACEFEADKPRQVDLRLGCINANKLWLNGELLGAHDKYHTGMEIDQYVARGTLRAGRNLMLLKICQNEQTEEWAQNWVFQLRVCDAIGTAVLAKNGLTPRK
jgi:outer membrane protein assembly factor BamB